MSLSAPFHFQSSQSPNVLKSCHFLFSQFLSLCPQCHSQWLLLLWSPPGKCPVRSKFLLFFPLEPKYLSSSENGLPWNTQHPMERFCLNLELQASQKKRQENWTENLAKSVSHSVQKVPPPHLQQRSTLLPLKWASVTRSSLLSHFWTAGRNWERTPYVEPNLVFS